MLDIKKLKYFLEEYQPSPEVKSTIDLFIDYIEGKQRTKGAAVISYARTQATKRLIKLKDNQARHKEDNLNPDEDFERIQDR